MTTYTVDHDLGAAPRSGLTAGEAAHEILTGRGGRYEIRREADEYRLYVSERGRMVPALAASAASDEGAAWADIADQVIRQHGDSRPYVMTDESCAEMSASDDDE